MYAQAKIIIYLKSTIYDKMLLDGAFYHFLSVNYVQYMNFYVYLLYFTIKYDRIGKILFKKEVNFLGRFAHTAM